MTPQFRLSLVCCSVVKCRKCRKMGKIWQRILLNFSTLCRFDKKLAWINFIYHIFYDNDDYHYLLSAGLTDLSFVYPVFVIVLYPTEHMHEWRLVYRLSSSVYPPYPFKLYPCALVYKGGSPSVSSIIYFSLCANTGCHSVWSTTAWTQHDDIVLACDSGLSHRLTCVYLRTPQLHLYIAWGLNRALHISCTKMANVFIQHLLPWSSCTWLTSTLTQTFSTTIVVKVQRPHCWPITPFDVSAYLFPL